MTISTKLTKNDKKCQTIADKIHRTASPENQTNPELILTGIFDD